MGDLLEFRGRVETEASVPVSGNREVVNIGGVREIVLLNFHSAMSQSVNWMVSAAVGLGCVDKESCAIEGSREVRAIEMPMRSVDRFPQSVAVIFCRKGSRQFEDSLRQARQVNPQFLINSL